MVVDNFSKDDNLIELQTTSQYNQLLTQTSVSMNQIEDWCFKFCSN